MIGPQFILTDRLKARINAKFQEDRHFTIIIIDLDCTQATVLILIEIHEWRNCSGNASQQWLKDNSYKQRKLTTQSTIMMNVKKIYTSALIQSYQNFQDQHLISTLNSLVVVQTLFPVGSNIGIIFGGDVTSGFGGIEQPPNEREVSPCKLCKLDA